MPRRIQSTEQAMVPVAEYVRMSTDHQKYSIENQHALIQAYAVAHNIDHRANLHGCWEKWCDD
jgi:hypothetical protein